MKYFSLFFYEFLFLGSYSKALNSYVAGTLGLKNGIQIRKETFGR